MVSGDSEESALGSARGRFLESLPRKATELRAAVAQLAELPEAEGPREDLRRRLHALYASALVFRNDPLARAVQECIERLDAARESGRALTAGDFGLLNALVKRLPDLRDDLPSGIDGLAGLASPVDELEPAHEEDPSLMLQRVLRVLLLPAPGEEGTLRALLSSESLRVGAVSTVNDVVAAVNIDAPDLIFANEQLAYTGGLVAKLRADPSTDFVPVVLYEDAQAEPPDVPIDDVDARVTRPLRTPQIMQAIGRVTGTLIAPLEPLTLGELTLDELSARVERELRRGLVDAAEGGRALTLPLGEGTEVLAVTHETIAALRAQVVRASRGRVTFEARPPRGALAIVSVGQYRDERVDDRRLGGRRVVLVEDDAAVALLLSNQLRAQGATVLEFTDGREAREAAQRERPDLVITGARVPNLDGFSLCRELARDPLLADVPVMLLPSKELLLRRGRELGAPTELNGEVVEQVVACAERLLRPRAQLEAKLRRPGEVRGSLDGTGVIALLRSVRRARPDAHIRIRDAWNLFECELRDGRLAQVTRTASDGSFVRNERALPQLLGALAGRFSVVEVDGAMKGGFDGTLDEVLTRGARELAGELDAVSGPQLSRVARVVFDEDAYALLVAQTPPTLREVMERLYAGESPAALLKSGLVDARALEPILLDMARRGALRGVVGTGGEDLIAEARASRARAQPIQLASPLSIVPPPPNPVISMLPSSSALAHELAVASLLDPRTDGPELPPGARPSPHVGPTTSGGIASRPSTPVPEAPVSNSQSPSQRMRESNPTDASELQAAAVEARRSRSTFAGWVLAFVALCALGFFAMRESDGSAGRFEALGSSPEAATHTTQKPAADATSAPPKAPDAPLVLAPRHKEGSLISAEDNGFAVYDGISDDGVRVGADQALLVVEASDALTDAVVFVNDRELGTPPQKLALPEGVHELAIKRGDAISYRFVAVHPGRTWVLRNP